MATTRRLSDAPLRNAAAALKPKAIARTLGAAAKAVATTVSKGWVPRATTRPQVAAAASTATPALQRPAVTWGGGLQHNGNNPEVVDTFGRSYSSRAFAPGGVGFEGGAAQQVFSSNKNMTGKPASTSLVLTNPGSTPLRLRVRLSVDEPASARTSATKELVVPPKGSASVPVASAVRDRAFTAFRADVEPLDAATKRARLHVDVVSHEKPAAAAKLAGLPLMKTEGERGYRVPPARLGEHPAYLQEVRFVMKAAGVQPDPVSDTAHWTPARVKAWVGEQQALGAAGRPTAFDPATNRAIQGRVNGLVAATAGAVRAAPLVASAPGAGSTVRLLPNRAPPEFATPGGNAARRPGTSLKDAGAYGKALAATLPVTNPGSTPITVTLAMRAPPPGVDGSQLPGHQVYNGPVSVTAAGAGVGKVPAKVRVDQPAKGSTEYAVAQLATLTVPPGKTVDVKVDLLVHANSQFPTDLVLTRTR